MIKNLLISYNLLFIVSLSAQNSKHLDNMKFVKLNLADLTFLNQYSIKLGYETSLKNKFYFAGIETGYVFYSMEDKIPVNGLYLESSIGRYIKSDINRNLLFKITPFYNITIIKQYLRYERELPDFGPYSEYVKTQYSKERFGLSGIFGVQQKISQLLYVELDLGLGYIQYRLNVPPDVKQSYFRLGLLRSGKMSINGIGALKVMHKF